MEHIGNCVDSFDEDGNCINPRLPWADVNEFACAVDEDNNVTVGNIVVLYNESTDIHSFYYKSVPFVV